MVDGLIFSKDRPAQLDLLLQSILRHAPDLYSSLTVLWRDSAPNFTLGYRKVIEESYTGPADRWLSFVHEGLGSFRDDVLDWLVAAGPLVGFLVDDLVFYRDVPETLCDSYRLGANVTYCYPRNRVQSPPERIPWAWRDFEDDWGYPLSLDAHVYKKENVGPLVATANFVDPNTLEHALWRRRHIYPPELLTCPSTSCAVSIPANLVNRSVANRHGTAAAEQPRTLLERYLDGGRLTLVGMDFGRVDACHAEIPLVWAAA